MARVLSLKVRLTLDEKNRLLAEANRRGVTMSEVMQDFCKQLPKVETAQNSDK